MKAPRHSLRAALAAVAAFAMLVALQTQTTWFDDAWCFWLAWLIAPALLTYFLWNAAGRTATRQVAHFAPVLALLGVMLLALASSFPLHKWFYFLRWYPGEFDAHKTELARVILITTLLAPLLAIRQRGPRLIVMLIFVASQVACFHALLTTTGGDALYRTDHPSFMFRLFEFTRTFPQLVNYNPYWNGGTEHFVGVTSGIAGPGLVAYPLLRFLPIHSVYTLTVALLFIVIIPWIAVGSIRAAGGDRTAGYVAGVLALGVSQHYFLWMLHYGTIGATFCGFMILPVSTLAFRAVVLGKRERWVGPALVAAAFCLLLWPPGAIMGTGVALAFLLHARHWTRRTWVFLLICGAAVLALYSQWIWVQLHEGNSVIQFVLTPRDASAPKMSWLNTESLQRGATLLIAHIQEGHPLLIFFGLVGVLTVCRRTVRNWFVPILLVLALITGWGQIWKHNSQFARMSIPMFFVAIAPASLLASRLLRAVDMRLALPRALLIALLAVGGYNVSRIYGNQSKAPYVTADDGIRLLTDYIREQVPEGARVAFAGRCVHAYGRGNVAYLPMLTGREMMADDYYGFPVGTIEYEYPPHRFRKDWDLLQHFFTCYNITHMVTYHDKWRDYFASHPDYFEEQLRFPSHHLTVTVHALKRDATPLVKGKGRVKARFNHIAVDLDDPQDEIVVPYNWMEHLTSPEGVELFPYEADPEITLIGARPNGKTSFEIVYRNIF